MSNTPKEQTAELLSFILDIDYLTTTEFCNKYGAPVPKWQGSVDVAVMDFLSIDARKWKLVVDKAKQIKVANLNQPPTEDNQPGEMVSLAAVINIINCWWCASNVNKKDIIIQQIRNLTGRE